MSRDRRSPIAYAALFAPVLLLAAVMAMTWRAEQRYARVSERVVHDYAAIAAWQYARRANMALHDETMHAFEGIASGYQRSAPGAPLGSPARILAARGSGRSRLVDSAWFAFTWNRATDSLAVAGGDVTAEVRSALLALMRHVGASSRAEGEPHRLIFDSIGHRSVAIALWTLAGPDAPVRAAYGVVSMPAAVHRRLSAAIEEPGLLPATSGVPLVTARDVAVRITRADGGVAFATDVPLGATAAVDSTGLRMSNARVTVDLGPSLARAVLLEQPSSQLPALALMLVVAALVAVLGVRHERRAAELERLRTRFVANVSHELRTPLAQISMFAETLALGRERTDGERRQFASIIVAEARRLTALVESVLRFSRSGRDAVALRLERASLRHEVDAAVEAFAPIARAAEVEVETSAEETHAMVDLAALRQVLLNLLDNAVKHGGRGRRVRVTVSRRDHAAEVAVEDAGPGVPAEWRHRVFEPFVRIERGTAGAGIGLAVVRDLVRAHGGEVRVEDAPKGGARFVVTLRRAEAREGASGPPETLAALPSAEAGHGARS